MRQGITPEKFAKQERLHKVARYYVRGWTQAHIAQELGVSQRQISRDIREIHVKWAQENTSTIEQSKLRVLASIDHVEEEAWAEWERSKHDAGATITEEMELGIGDQGKPEKPKLHLVTADEPPPDLPPPVKIKTRKESRGRLADARYLQVINQCRDDRCKLLGLYPQGLPVNWELLRQMTREQMQRVASGEDPFVVLATSSAMDAGTPRDGASLH